MNADNTITKLIAAGAVTVNGIEPIFTKPFLDYCNAAISKSPSKEDSSKGWREILSDFNPVLATLETHQLGIAVALLSYHLTIADVRLPIEKTKE